LGRRAHPAALRLLRAGLAGVEQGPHGLGHPARVSRRGRREMSLSLIGWLATAVFASSYLFRQPLMLRRIQAGAACLWAIDAVPVVVANLIVAGAALYSSFAQRETDGRSKID